MNAAVLANEVPVKYDERPEVNRDFLTIDVPNGWNDVKRISKKVLLFDRRRFTFSGWNSDSLKCYFVAPHGDNATTATIQ